MPVEVKTPKSIDEAGTIRQQYCLTFRKRIPLQLIKVNKYSNNVHSPLGSDR